MRPQIHAVVLPSDTSEFTDDLRRLAQELGRFPTADALTGECSPALDVYETDETLEVVVDLPGVDPAHLRVVAKGDALLIVGLKSPRRGAADSSYHLVERGYGRFARAVRLATATDPRRTRATLANGELRLSLPKLRDRRHEVMPIAIAHGTAHS